MVGKVIMMSRKTMGMTREAMGFCTYWKFIFKSSNI
jgi:hypothetical protein